MAKSVKVRANLDLSGVRKDLQKIKKEVAGTTVSFKSDSVNNVRKNIDKATKSTGLFGQSIFDAGKKFLTWMVLGKAISSVLRTIEDAVMSVKTLDDNLTLMSFTSEFTNTQFNEMVDLTEELAVSLGSTNAEVIESVKIYTNLNSTLEEIISNSEAAVVLSNLGGAAISIADSADALLSLQNQFGLTNEHAMEITDTLTFISATLAMDFSRGIKEISNGIAISGALAHEAGIEYSLYMAILGKTVEATRRSGSSISAGLKTIISRLTRVSELGAEEISKLEGAYADIGIQIRKSETEFFDFGTILDQLADKWGTLDGVTKSYIGELSAGVRQKSTFLAVVNNYAEAEALATQALEEQGFALEQNAKFIESIQGRLNLFRTTLQELARDVITSDMFKNIIDGGTAFLKILISLEKSIGLINIALVTTIGLMNVKMLAILPTLTLEIGILAESLGLASGAALGLGAVLSGGLVVAGVLVAVAAFDHFNVSLKENIKLLEETQTEISSLEGKVKSFIEQGDELSKKDKLRQKGAEARIKLLEIEEDRLVKLTAQQKLASTFGRQETRVRGELVVVDDLKATIETLEEYKDIQEGVTDATEKYELELETGLIDKLETLQEIFGSLTSDELIGLFGEERYRELVKLKNGLNDYVGVVSDVDIAMRKYSDAVEGKTKVEEDSNDETVRSIEELSRLAELYPIATQSMIEDEIALTEEKIKNTELRIIAMELEMKALDRLIQANVAAGGSFYVPEALTRDYTADVLAIEGLRDRLEGLTGVHKKYFETTKKGKTETVDLMLAYKQLFQTLADNEQTISTIDSAMSRMTDEEKIRGNQRLIEEFEKQKVIIVQIRKAMEDTIATGKLTEEQNRELTEAIYDQNNAWQSAQTSIFNANKEIEDIRQSIQDLADKDLEELKEQLEDTADVIADKLNEALSDEIDLLKEQKEVVEARFDAEIKRLEEDLKLLGKKNDKLDEELRLQEALQAVENARSRLGVIEKERTVRLFTGEEFEFVADPREVLQAEKDLANAEKNLDEIRIDQERQVAEEKIEIEIDKLEKEKQAELDAFDVRIEQLEGFKEQVKESVEAGNAIEEELLNQIIDIVEQTELDSYDTRLDNLLDFVNQYNATLAQINAIPTTGGGREFETLTTTTGETVKIPKLSESEAKKIFEAEKAKIPSKEDGIETGLSPGGLTLLHPGEGVFNPPQMNNIANFVRDMALGNIPTPINNGGGTPASNQTIFDIGNITLPNVKDPQSFVAGLRTLANNRS